MQSKGTRRKVVRLNWAPPSTWCLQPKQVSPSCFLPRSAHTRQQQLDNTGLSCSWLVQMSTSPCGVTFSCVVLRCEGGVFTITFTYIAFNLTTYSYRVLILSYSNIMYLIYKRASCIICQINSLLNVLKLASFTHFISLILTALYSFSPRHPNAHPNQSHLGDQDAAGAAVQFWPNR